MQDHRSPGLVAPETRDRPPGHRHRRLGPQRGQSRRVVAQEVGGRHQEAMRMAQATPLCQRRHGGSARARPDVRAGRGPGHLHPPRQGVFGQGPQGLPGPGGRHLRRQGDF